MHVISILNFMYSTGIQFFTFCKNCITIVQYVIHVIRILRQDLEGVVFQSALSNVMQHLQCKSLDFMTYGDGFWLPACFL